MVGEGVMHECLKHDDVEKVLVINRKLCGVEHDKLTEIIHQNFQDFSAILDRLTGYNACYFCMGVSSVGKDAETYRRITYDLTMHVAQTLVSLNPEMTFCYVSGVGTDSSEQGRSAWARVKGKTENDLLKLPFKAAYMFRPGYIQPTRGLKHAYRIYTVTAPLYPVIRLLFPKYVSTLKEIGLAMIQVARQGYDQPILECRDIVRAAQRSLNKS
jgi:hypothetical protein